MNNYLKKNRKKESNNTFPSNLYFTKVILLILYIKTFFISLLKESANCYGKLLHNFLNKQKNNIYSRSFIEDSSFEKKYCFSSFLFFFFSLREISIFFTANVYAIFWKKRKKRKGKTKKKRKEKNRINTFAFVRSSIKIKLLSFITKHFSFRKITDTRTYKD